MSGVSPDRLWISGEGLTFSCERPECAGEGLTPPMSTPGVTTVITENGSRMHLMNRADLAELAAIASALNDVITCKCGMVSYQRATKQLVRRKPR